MTFTGQACLRLGNGFFHAKAANTVRNSRVLPSTCLDKLAGDVTTMSNAVVIPLVQELVGVALPHTTLVGTDHAPDPHGLGAVFQNLGNRYQTAILAWVFGQTKDNNRKEIAEAVAKALAESCRRA